MCRLVDGAALTVCERYAGEVICKIHLVAIVVVSKTDDRDVDADDDENDEDVKSGSLAFVAYFIA